MATFTDAEKDALIQEIISKIKDESSTSIEELSSVTSLDGVESLPGIKGDYFVKAPIELLSRPAKDAETRANAATSDLNQLKSTLTQATTNANAAANSANEAAQSASEAAQSATLAASTYEPIALEAREGATERLGKILSSTPAVVSDSTIETDLDVVYDPAANTMYATDWSNYFRSWPERDFYLDSDGQVLKDKAYICDNRLYIWNAVKSTLVMASGGGNTINVMAISPKTDGSFYTLGTAIVAVPEEYRGLGKCISYQISSNKWETKQFIGTSLDSWETTAAWDDFGGGGTVKTVTLNGVPQTINPDGSLNLVITQINVLSTIDENSTDPVQSKVIAAELKKYMSKDNLGIVVNTTGEGASLQNSISLTYNGEEFATTDPFSGGGSGGGSTNPTKIVLTRIGASVMTVKLGTSVSLAYKYDHIDTTTEETTGLSAQSTITITHGTNVNTITRTIAAGNTDSIDPTSLLGEGTNTVRVRVQVEIGVDESTGSPIYSTYAMSWTINVVNLVLGSTFRIDTVINKGDTFTVPFTVSGAGNKTVRCYVDGTEVESKAVLTSTGNGSFTIDSSRMSHGSHSVQLVCELLLSDGTVLKSRSFYFDVAVRENGNKTPIVAAKFEYESGTIIDVQSGARPYLETRQFDNYTLTYAAYDPTKTPTIVYIREGGVLVSQANVNFSITTMSTKAISSGTIPCTITVGSTVYNYNMVISKSDITLSEPTDNMKLKLTTQGRTNLDSNKTEWVDNEHGITSNLTGIKFGGDGWNNGLVLKDGGHVSINYKPLAQPDTYITNSSTFLIKFKTSNVTNETDPLIRCMDSTGCGFVITANEAKYVSRGGSVVSMPLAEDNVYEIGFVSYPEASDNSNEDEVLNSKVNYLYINGIASNVVQRGLSDSIYQSVPSNIELGGTGATLTVYNIRSWNYYLTDDQILDCWVLDQDDAETLLSEYKQNNIVDGSGNITTDTITDLPYMIITGKADNEMAQVLNAAVVNDKNAKYNITSILFVDPTKEHQNWYCEGGCIRLQGTSSLAYPIKNYRIYFKNAQKVAGKLYLDCDSAGNGGTLVSKPKLSFHPANASGKSPAPVDCFCLKADYAESSGSHNTGMARFANDILVQANELTPAQANVTSDYKYDVRTTIDGYPMLLFYRSTTDEVPKFLGKYNFNNDKSTEAVFGFCDIPGYNTQALDYGEFTEIVAPPSVVDSQGLSSYAESYDKSGWNTGSDAVLGSDGITVVTPAVAPTIYVFSGYDLPDHIVYEYTGSAWSVSEKTVNNVECWEFLNNELPMGRFQDADFTSATSGTPNWTNVFEQRYPNNDSLIAAHEGGTKLPYWLKRLVTWLNSTKDNPTKFASEASSYFNVNYLADYYVLTVIFACVDQRVKNMMWGFWYDPKVGKELCYPIFYDCDTILGVRNDGRLKYKWDVDDDTLDSELTASAGTNVYAFAGHDSVVWTNLKAAFPDKIAAAYIRLRQTMGGSNSMIYKYFDTMQSDKFCERIYNIDAQNKYISPLTKGVDVVVDGVVKKQTYNFIESMQGSRKAHRHWWVENRLSLLDAQYTAGQYKATEINWKGVTDSGVSISATSSRNFYFLFSSDSGILKQSEIEPGTTWTYQHPSATAIGSIFHLYGIRFMKTLDLSQWGGFADINFIGTFPVLEELILGKSDSGKTYTIPNFSLVGRGSDGSTSSVIPMVKKLVIQNYTGITSLNLSGATRLEDLDLAGCTSLSSITLEEGIPLKRLVLPANFKSLYLRSLSQLSRENLILENAANIENLWVENCDKIDGYALFNELRSLPGSKLKNVRLVGLNIRGNGNDLINLMNAGVGGIDAQGNVISRCSLYGDYYLTSYLADEGDTAIYNQLNSYFDLNIHEPEYTTISFLYAVKDDSGTWVDVPLEKNISNLDNSTGVVFNNSYKPSGHINKILNKRHRVLAKNKNHNLISPEKGTKIICQLDDDNSNYFAENRQNAVINGSQGDWMMYEPHFWYKGVNDYLNHVQYGCWGSFDTKPTNKSVEKGYIKVITLDNLKTQGNWETGKAVSISTKVASKSNATNFAVGTIDVTNVKMVRFQTSFNQTSCFVDSGSFVIGDPIIPSTKDFQEGMDVIAKVPGGATKLLFTFPSNFAFDRVITSSEVVDVLDMEPDWVEHKQELIGITKGVNSSSRLRSVSGSWLLSQTLSTYESYASAAGSQLIDVNEHFLVGNLFYAKYGRRNSVDQCGSLGANGAGGTTVDYGMHDTYINNSSKCVYMPNSGVETAATMLNCMGYEQWFAGGSTERVSGIVVDYGVWTYKDPSGLPVKIKSKIVTQPLPVHSYFMHVAWGKYMALIPVGSDEGTSATGFCDTCRIEGAAAQELGCGSAYLQGYAWFHFLGYGGVAHSTSPIHPGGLPCISSRIAFRGNIEWADSVSNFVLLTDSIFG